MEGDRSFLIIISILCMLLVIGITMKLVNINNDLKVQNCLKPIAIEFCDTNGYISDKTLVNSYDFKCFHDGRDASYRRYTFTDKERIECGGVNYNG